MAKTILWLSQHRPNVPQEAGLRRLFGDVEIRQDVNPFEGAQEILARFQEGGYNDLVVVAPLSVIDHLCRLGLRPLWAETVQVPRREGAHFSYRGRHYRFLRFRRVKAVRMEWTDVHAPCFAPVDPDERGNPAS